MLEIEHFFSCPYCGADISMLLDPAISRQSYIEDCEVCCHPIQIKYELEGEDLLLFDAISIEQ